MIFAVAPFTGAWIEIATTEITGYQPTVAPFTGAWIEIQPDQDIGGVKPVAPFTGAWIEISQTRKRSRWLTVAPFTGAWIEIWNWWKIAWATMSLPSRERGLKFHFGLFLVSRGERRSLHGSVD